MPKNGSKTGKSSKTARVLSLLTDPAASLLGGARNHEEENQDNAAEEPRSKQAARGLDDAATESRIQASLAAEEDSLVTELFGKKEPSRAPRPEVPAPEASAPAAPAPQASAPAPQTSAQEPDPRTLELLSMLSNPSTLGNSAMPSFDDETPRRPAALDMDFADELTAGMAPQPAPEPEPEPEPDWPPQPAQQAAPQYAPQPTQQAAPQSAPQPVQQAAPQYAPQPTPQPAPRPVRQVLTQPVAQPIQQAASQPATEHDNDHFVCFNLTQALVEDKAEKLMRQFGMCTCNRCKVDVTAIALSNLPAKYVAMQNRDILPLLSMYEEKYSAAVTVQVMSACKMVMRRPHHGR